MDSKNNYAQIIQKAKSIFKEEQSFPAVYRRLIKMYDPDTAISAIYELQRSGIRTKYPEAA